MSYLTILARVAALYQLRPEDIIDPDRSAPRVEARHVAMFLAFRSRPDWSEIAAAFQRNHNTIRHAVKSVSARMDTEKKFRARVTEIAGSLGLNASGPMGLGASFCPKIKACQYPDGAPRSDL